MRSPDPSRTTTTAHDDDVPQHDDVVTMALCVLMALVTSAGVLGVLLMHG